MEDYDSVPDDWTPCSPWVFTAFLAPCILVQACAHPLDIVKARMQAAPLSKTSEGSAATVRDLWRHDGLSGLKRGLATSLIGGALQYSIYYYGSDGLLFLYGNWSGLSATPTLHSFPLAIQCAFSSVLGATTSVLMSPLNRVKIIQQVAPQNVAGPSFLELLSHIWCEEGVSGLIRGALPSALIAAFGPSVSIPLAEYLIRLVPRPKYPAEVVAELERLGVDVPLSESLTLSLIALLGTNIMAGAVATAITHPMDSIRTRMTTSSASDVDEKPAESGRTPTEFQSFKVTAKDIYTNGGWKAFLAGLYPALTRGASMTLLSGILGYVGGLFIETSKE